MNLDSAIGGFSAGTISVTAMAGFAAITVITGLLATMVFYLLLVRPADRGSM